MDNFDRTAMLPSPLTLTSHSSEDTYSFTALPPLESNGDVKKNERARGEKLLSSDTAVKDPSVSDTAEKATVTPTARPGVGEEGDTRILTAGDYVDSPGYRKKHPRMRKKLKKYGNGWEEPRKEPPLHEADKHRYDLSIPWDQRLLRAVDEWRSLRALSLDKKLNLDYLLVHMKCDVFALRQKYGHQALRGFTREAGHIGEYDEEEEEGRASVESEDEPDTIEMEDVVDEESWGNRTLTPEAVAKFLEDRSNDGYAPTLKFAPTVLANFLTFLLARNVFPSQDKKIKESLPVSEIAKVQLPPASSLLKVLPGAFHFSLKVVFPEKSSALDSPIPQHCGSVEEPKSTIPSFISAATFLDETQDNLDEDTSPLGNWPVPGEDSPTSTETKPDPALENDPVKHAEMVRKHLEEQAKIVEAWKIPEMKREDAIKCIKETLTRSGFAVEEEGVWRMGFSERSARSILSWEKIVDPELSEGSATVASTSSNGASNGQNDSTPLFRLYLSAHHHDFPVTSNLTPPDFLFLTGNHSLDTPINVIINESQVKNLVAGLVFEADYSQIFFSSNLKSTTSVEKPVEVWNLRALYRILPSYFSLAGEYLRDEPGRQRSFPGGWGPPIEEFAPLPQEDEVETIKGSGDSNEAVGSPSVKRGGQGRRARGRGWGRGGRGRGRGRGAKNAVNV